MEPECGDSDAEGLETNVLYVPDTTQKLEIGQFGYGALNAMLAKDESGSWIVPNGLEGFNMDKKQETGSQTATLNTLKVS